jgi:hypothetical protein
MKRDKGLREERLTALETSASYAEEERLQFAGTEGIAETYCSDADFWAESDRPAAADRPDLPVAS